MSPALAAAAREYADRLRALADRQEELKSRASSSWDAAYLRLREEQARVLASSPTATPPAEPSLTEEDRAKLSSQAVDQNALRSDLQGVESSLEELSHHTARLGPRERRRLEGAAAAMSRAAAALGEARPPDARTAQEEALRLLRESEEAARSMTSPIFGGGAPSGGGASPGGGPSSPWGGRPVGPTRLPRAKDYHPPKEFREDVLRALQEKYPARDRGVIEDYFKRWKK